MRAAVYEQFRGPIAVVEVADPVPQPGEVVVEVLAAQLKLLVILSISVVAGLLLLVAAAVGVIAMALHSS